RGLGARVGEAPLRKPKSPRELSRDLYILGHRLREVRALGYAVTDRLDDLGMCVSDHHHPEAVVEVDILVAVDVPDPAALSPLHEHRLGGGVLEGRWDPSRHDLARLVPKLLRSGPRLSEPPLLMGRQLIDAGARPLTRGGRAHRWFPSQTRPSLTAFAPRPLIVAISSFLNFGEGKAWGTPQP